MNITATTHLRRGELMEWLKGFGLKPDKVKLLIQSGVIPTKHIPHKRRVRAERASRSSSKTPRAPSARKGGKGSQKLITGRAFFVAGAVAKALEIEL